MRLLILTTLVLSMSPVASLAEDPTPSPAEVTRAQDQVNAAEWAKSLDLIPNGGWQFINWIGPDEQGMVFASTHHVTRAGSAVTLWLRWEYRSDQSSGYMSKYRSNVTQEQIDCSRQGSRVLAVSYYLENNLGGGSPTSYSYDEKSATWSPAIPGTLGEYLANWACNKYKAPSSTR